MTTKYTTYFEVNKVNITKGVMELLREEKAKTSDLLLLIERHKFNDDDNPHKEDLKENARALQQGGMFLSVYKNFSKKIYIISYFNRYTSEAEETTILLASEY